MGNKIWIYIDQFKGQPHNASWEVLGAGLSLAGELGGGVSAIVVGPQATDIAQQAFQFGADEVYASEDDIFNDFRAEPYTTLVCSILAEHQPEVLLFPTTTRGRELAGMCAIDLKSGVMPDVIAMDVKDGKVVVTRPVYAGKILSEAVCNAHPQIITTRTRAFAKPEPDSTRSGTPIIVESTLTEDNITSKVGGYKQSEEGVSLADAGVIVSGGRGVSNNPSLTPPEDLDEDQAEKWRAQKGFELVGNLAEVLGAAVGASRAAVDAEYIPYKHQVGQTGKVVSPDLYVACGISGAIQHLAGMRTSKVIVAVNKDTDAPIFRLARFGVVGDLFEILPPLAEALHKRLGK